MMGKTVLIIIGLLMGLHIYAGPREPEKEIALAGKYGFVSSGSVQVTINSSNTLTASFKADVGNVMITVKKQDGEIISSQVVDAKEFDEFYVRIDNYRRGGYVVEISTAKGVLEGKF